MDSEDLTTDTGPASGTVLAEVSAGVAGTAASVLVSDSVVGAGVGPGSVSGSGILSGIALGGDPGPHMDMVVTTLIPTATSTAIPIRETTFRTTILHPRNRTTNTIRIIRELQMEIG